jgi:ADP-heptose:LPS heptosyltransferase
MKILINRGNIHNAKSYPYWEELLVLLKDFEIKEVVGILSEEELIELINWCDIWVSIDSFMQHLVAFHNLKPGIVLWGKSNPKMFGYKTNSNLLGDIKNLRKDQFVWWKDIKSDPNDFVLPSIVFNDIIKREVL